MDTEAEHAMAARTVLDMMTPATLNDQMASVAEPQQLLILEVRATGPHVHMFTYPRFHMFTYPPTCSHIHVSTCPHVHVSTCSRIRMFTSPYHVHVLMSSLLRRARPCHGEDAAAFVVWNVVPAPQVLGKYETLSRKCGRDFAVLQQQLCLTDLLGTVMARLRCVL